MNDEMAELQRHEDYIRLCEQRIVTFESRMATLLRERLEMHFPWLLQQDGYLPHSFSEDVDKLRALHTELKEEELHAHKKEVSA